MIERIFAAQPVLGRVDRELTKFFPNGTLRVSGRDLVRDVNQVEQYTSALNAFLDYCQAWRTQRFPRALFADNIFFEKHPVGRQSHLPAVNFEGLPELQKYWKEEIQQQKGLQLDIKTVGLGPTIFCEFTSKFQREEKTVSIIGGFCLDINHKTGKITGVREYSEKREAVCV